MIASFFVKSERPSVFVFFNATAPNYFGIYKIHTLCFSKAPHGLKALKPDSKLPLRYYGQRYNNTRFGDVED